MWIDEIDEIKFGTYGPGRKDFGRVWRRVPITGPKNVEDWISCREVFHRENRGLKRFYFCHRLPHGKGRSISVFLDKIEDRLNLSPENRTRCGPTNKRTIMRVDFSEY